MIACATSIRDAIPFKGVFGIRSPCATRDLRSMTRSEISRR